MSDHPSTIEGALKWAKVAAECFGDEPPDMDSVALQTLASECLALRARAEKAEAEAKRKEQYLEAINDLMWNTWAIKGRRFGRDEGARIMEILEAWSAKQAIAGKGK